MRLAAGIALLATALLAPAAAPAATVTTDLGCYYSRQPATAPQGQRIHVAADGFTPGAPVTFSLPTGPVALAAADPTGHAVASFISPALVTGQYKATRTLTASDGLNQATTPVRLRVLAATFAPTQTRDATKQKVRFFVFGMGPGLVVFKKPIVQTVYMHVLLQPPRKGARQPPARLRGSFKVGRTSGPCGDLRTARRKILPFGFSEGTWIYRFSLTRRYDPGQIWAQARFRVCTVFLLPGVRPPSC